ncbi:hypothetical protein BDP55DRAFT_625684 [Colletotrichum godetiae]|uniref:Uncharacterized protein n=1 Tax=Colletotrichum godetiae TaxID=1209918 RepID=A0AAJ0B090_9PEZI|nr:uncharacterized protein BDP55DRAFT_625684 [Colletotrichum godetiae]KAK1701465.1 hypothetical protein BDP55DRAFT_625684 [Colletotrichum godetiae]
MTDLRQRVPVGGLSDVGGDVICLDDDGVIDEGGDVGVVGVGGSAGGYYYYDDGSEGTSESETSSDDDEECGGCGDGDGCRGCWEDDECYFEMVGCLTGGGRGRGSCGFGFECEVGTAAMRGRKGRKGKCKECEKKRKCKACEKRKKKKKGKGFWSTLYPVKKLGEWGGDVVGVSRYPGEVSILFSVPFAPLFDGHLAFWASVRRRGSRF